MLGTSKNVSGFDPRTVPGCQLWLDGNDPAGTGTLPANGATVSTWVDKSGNGRNGTATGTTPTFASGGGITFSAGAYNTSYSSSLTNESLFVVSRYTRTSGTLSLVGQTGDGARLLALGGGASTAQLQSSVYNVAVGALSLTTTVPINTIGISELITTNSTMGIFYNGTSVGTPTAVTFTSGRTSIIGGASNAGSINTSQYFGGIIHEVLGFTSVLTTSERQQIEGYLAHKWGLTGYYVPTTPLSIPGCQLWLDAADSSTIAFSSGSNISSWVDKSGNGRNATQSTGSQQPTYTSGPKVSFNKTNSQFMRLPNGTIPFGNSEYSFYFVHTPQSGDTDVVFSSGDFSTTGGTNGLYYNSSIYQNYWFNQDATMNIGAVIGQRTLITVTYTQNVNRYIYLTGTLQNTTASSNRNSLSTNNIIGAEGPSPGRGYYSSVDFHELIIYNTGHSVTQRQTIEGYLSKKWGIRSSTIPSTHPFSSVRPHLRTFQPIDVPGCQLWLDGADQSSMNFTGSNITQWNDKSGNGYNATVASGRIGATYSTAYNAVNFATSNTGYVTSYPANPTNETMFVVFNNVTPDNYNFILIGGQQGARSLGTGGGTTIGAATYLNSQVAWMTGTPAGSYTAGRTALVTGQFSGSSTSISLNGGTISTGGGTTFYSGTTTHLGVDTTSTLFYYVGYAMEIIFYNSVLTASQRQQVEGYLAWKWGLVSIPVSSTPTLSVTSGCQLWLDGNDPLGTGVKPIDGAQVTIWTDKSGNGRNATVAPNRSVGTYSTAYNAVNFPNSTTGYITTYSAAPTNETMFVVGNNPSPSSANNIIIGGVSGARSLGFGYTAAGLSTVGNLNTQVAWLASIGTYFAGTTAITRSLFTPTSNSISLNGGTTSTGGAPGFTAGRVTYLGVDATNGFYHYSGYLMEALFYNRILTNQEIQEVENYLTQKWLTTTTSVSFSSTHPFFKIPPAIAAHFFPTNISGCQLWLDAADSLAITLGTGVSQWTDKSGNANNLTQSTPLFQPTYASNLMTFANDKHLNIPTSVMNNLPTWSLFFVINPISSSNWIMSKQKDGVDSYNILSMTINNNTFGGLQSGSLASLYWRSMNAGTQFVSPDPVTISTLQFCSLTYDGTNLYFYKNGELNQTTSGTFAIQNQTSPNTYTLGVLVYPGGEIKNPGATNFKLGEMIIYNTFLTNAQREQIEGYFAHKWGLTSSLYSTHPYKPLPPIFPPTVQYNLTATGGIIVYTVGTTYHVFRNSSSFVVRRAVTVNYLVVGGGGGGGDRHGGGGGAGGVLSGTWSASAGTYTVTVGAGGQYGATSEGGQTAYGSPNGSGSKGGDSVVSGTGISITAYGGGGGGSYDGNPTGTVGSGGGGGGQNLSGIAGTAGQGNAGGGGLLPGGGGGGGAGGAGVAANTGTGGIGTSSFSAHLLSVGYGTTFAVPTSPNTVISGGVAYIAGGGGGCAATSPGPGGSGGLGGGGRGDWADTNITAGTPNTGGGGGGTRSHPDSLQTTGRNGGSGLVLLWY